MTTDLESVARRADDLPDMREFIDFLREVCRLLIECGCSSNRVELLTLLLGESWGFEVETLAIPTGVWLSVRRDHLNLVELTRVRSWSVDLDRLAQLSDLVDVVHGHRLTIAEAHERLRQLGSSKPPYGRLLTLLAGASASPVLLFFYGAPPKEIALGLPIGILVQLLDKYVFSTTANRRYLSDTLNAACAALYAYLCHRFAPDIDMPRLIVGGIIILVPGLIVVNAVHEVAQKNLVSGAAKLLEAMMIAASLGCGVLAVLGLIQAFG